jgi:DHA2 family multidrug resistance protein-like MFS transporter
LAEGLPVPARYWSALTIWLGITMAVIDSAIANVALPTIARDLSAAPAESIWVVNAYQLTIVVSLLPFAALGEMIGYRRVYLVGVVAFTLASLGCTLVHSLEALSVMRAIQGLGAASIMAVNGALVRLTYPTRQLGRGIGLNALVVSIASAIGPTMASAILAVGPWQWLFAINVPLGILVYLVGRRTLPSNILAGRLDVTDAALNAATFGLVFTGTDGLTRGGSPWIGGLELGLALATGSALVLRTRRQERPLMPIDLLRNPVFTLSVLTSVASFTAQMLAFVVLPFYLQSGLHRTEVETGLLMTPWPFAVGVSAVAGGHLSDRFPAAVLGAIGLTALATGLLLLAFLPAEGTTFAIVWRMALCGLGFGLFQAPNNRIMLSSAPLGRSGAAGGMLATARLTGQTLGATLAAICFRVAANAEEVAFMAAAGFALVAAVVSLSRLSQAGPVMAAEGRPAASVGQPSLNEIDRSDYDVGIPSSHGSKLGDSFPITLDFTHAGDGEGRADQGGEEAEHGLLARHTDVRRS